MRLTRAQIELRERWSRHVPSPSFTVLDERYLVEEYVRGSELPALPVPDQVRTYRGLLTGPYTMLVQAEGDSRHGDAVAATLSDDVHEQLRPELQELLSERERQLVASSATLLVPTFADHSAGHIVVDADGTPQHIDCMPMTWRPFLYPPLFVLARSRRVPALRSGYLAGAFDEALQELFAAADVTLELDARLRWCLLMCTLLWRHMTDPDQPSDPEAISRQANRLFVASGWSGESPASPRSS